MKFKATTLLAAAGLTTSEACLAQGGDLGAVFAGSAALVIMIVCLIWFLLLLVIPFVLWRIRSEVIAMRAMQRAIGEDVARAARAAEFLSAESARVMRAVPTESQGRPGGG